MRRARILAFCLAALAPFPATGRAQLGRTINETIDKGTVWLRTKQFPDGAFEDPARREDPMYGGETALVVYALLHSGVPDDAPEIQRALRFLEYVDYKRTYAASVTALAYHATGRIAYNERIFRIAEWLESCFDRKSGLWAYPVNDPDLSNTQFAVLALRAASKRGRKNDPRILADVLKTLLRTQNRDGGFPYRPGGLSRGSMTFGAVASLRILSEELARNSVMAALKHDVASAVKRASAWLERFFSVAGNPEGNGALVRDYFYYYLYSMERYADIHGIRTVGTHDWYAEGAERIISAQKADGDIAGVVDTSFALLFLSRASTTFSSTSRPAADDNRYARGDAPVRFDPPGDDVPFLRKWLVAGPFPCPDDGAFAAEPFSETKVRPVAGEAAGRDRWRAFESPEDEVDMDRALGRGFDWASCYAAVWLRTRAPQRVILWLSSDDGNRVLLNGEKVFESHHHGPVGRDSCRVPLDLRAGSNLLLIKIEETTYFCRFAARISDPVGRPPADLAAVTSR